MMTLRAKHNVYSYFAFNIQDIKTDMRGRSWEMKEKMSCLGGGCLFTVTRGKKRECVLRW